MSEEKEGLVVWGANNIFEIYDGTDYYECRFKGKVLKTDSDEYNPLAPGDRVVFTPDNDHKGNGSILSRVERKNGLTRWNKKKGSPQIFAANIDNAVIVSSADFPPFRPRFIDRVLVSLPPNCKPIVLLNKCDFPVTEEMLRRLEVYEQIGVSVYQVSALDRCSLDPVIEVLKDKTSVFIGQSGVGKSTLLNLLFPDALSKTGEISQKFNRGRHTTTLAQLYIAPHFTVIDTPGIREIEVYGIELYDLSHYFPEFAPFSEHCQFGGRCLHETEPGCKVVQAATSGEIHEDRYQSYLNLLENIRMEQQFKYK